MRPFQSGLYGAAFAGALSILVFFLKIICPISVGCFVDPFLVVLFYPLKIFSAFGLSNVISYASQPYAILAFWIIVGFLCGIVLSPFFAKEKPEQEPEYSDLP